MMTSSPGLTKPMMVVKSASYAPCVTNTSFSGLISWSPRFSNLPYSFDSAAIRRGWPWNGVAVANRIHYIELVSSKDTGVYETMDSLTSEKVGNPGYPFGCISGKFK